MSIRGSRLRRLQLRNCSLDRRGCYGTSASYALASRRPSSMVRNLAYFPILRRVAEPRYGRFVLPSTLNNLRRPAT